MACPIVAGSAALIRQYFMDDSFYAHDVVTRGLCRTTGCFPGDSFTPSAATLKVRGGPVRTPNSIPAVHSSSARVIDTRTQLRIADQLN